MTGNVVKAEIATASTNPKLFISYSWSSEEHETWIITLATALRESGVDVILDKWDLKEGQDAHKFMEQMVSNKDIRKVALICDQTYAKKADDRDGGVGTETQIITPEIYQKEDQNKFVAVIVSRDENGKPYLPVFYKSRVYIDLSDNDLYAKNFEQLLRWIFDKPLHEKPPLGEKPAFLNETSSPSLETTGLYKRAIDAIRFDRSHWAGALSEYFDRFTANMENFRISFQQGENDEKIVTNIEQFLPYRNEAIEIFLALAQHKVNTEAYRLLHRFFERLLPYMDRPSHITSYTSFDFDNYKFIIHELFLYCVASMLKYENFGGVAYFLRQQYYLDGNQSDNNMISFRAFREYMESFEGRSKRLGCLSARADLLKSRCESTGLPFQQLMQADFTLYLRGCLDVLKADDRFYGWWPETLLYARRANTFEIYARAQSKEYFNLIAPIFSVQKKEDFSPLADAIEQGKLDVPKWQFDSFSPLNLMGYEKLATKD